VVIHDAFFEFTANPSQESKLFEKLFKQIVRQRAEVGLAQDQHGFLGDQYVSFSG
jgi:hypothetical protein